MTRVYVVVEGPTEESFIKNLLAAALYPRQIYLTPIILGPPGHKGGNTNYTRVKKDVIAMLKQEATTYCSTMLDFYGLGDGFPGFPPPAGLSNIQKVTHIEVAVKTDIIAQVGDRRPDVRFVPYVQLHEYEGLLFSDPEAFASGIGQEYLGRRFRAVRDEFATPEDIDDSAATAPSKRVLHAYPAYRKALDGTVAALAVGIERMRQECPHFRAWLERLEALSTI